MKGVGSGKKAVKIVLWSILGLVLLLIAIVEGTLLVQKYIKKAPVPMFMGYASLVVTTGSMTGTIDAGDVIIVRKADNYKLGDIVTYLETGKSVPVTHRLVNYGAEEGTFIAKGDANNTTDTLPITKDQIAGKVVLVIPKLGLVYNWFLKGGGIIFLATAVVVIFAAVYFWKQAKAAPKDDVQHADENTVKENKKRGK